MSSTFGDPLRFRSSSFGFIGKSLKAPIGEVVKLHVGKVILWVQTLGVSSVDDVLL